MHKRLKGIVGAYANPFYFVAPLTRDFHPKTTKNLEFVVGNGAKVENRKQTGLVFDCRLIIISTVSVIRN